MPASCYRRESSTETARTTGVRIERTTATDVNGEDNLVVGVAIKRARGNSSSCPGQCSCLVRSLPVRARSISIPIVRIVLSSERPRCDLTPTFLLRFYKKHRIVL